MSFEKVEKPAEGSLGVFFACPSCEAKVSMVTNPGETQMVSSLGVQLGGRTVEQTPLEMTRGTLKEEVSAPAAPGSMAAYLNEKINAGKSAAPAGAPATKEGEGGCPFSTMVAQMGLTSGGATTSTPPSDLQWSPDAQERLGKLPSFVQPMVKGSVESYARKNGFTTVTLQVMDDSKNASDGMTWSADAKERLNNIPDFIQPMAKKEIERLAQERGATSITAELMDEAKDKFMKFM
ncbi:PCP reductase family protein [Candidatus Nitronereus thalassa]|uniref:PCP reductase family protein n=1 Tax=Candidatus Nitronereus thalassa TaxID=3020898 RepID=A0ABU3K9A4_9BACT|nr:PCP reductase family protein [Candidatus Nitronereus thalassa]MDT7042995.1 PCP reductase family protein [Candidatus Nitronereus thalassa]